MQGTLNIIDDFFPDAKGIRDFGLTHDFTQEPEVDGHRYPGFAPVRDPRFTESLAKHVEYAIGQEVKINIACFVAGTAEFSTTQWIHADNLAAGYAGVIYLFDKPGFGTQFWKHSATKAETITEHVGFLKGMAPEKIADALQAQGRDEMSWVKTDYADSKLNRLIFYPTTRFHSRWPEKAFGDAPENCRLTISFFFDILA